MADLAMSPTPDVIQTSYRLSSSPFGFIVYLGLGYDVNTVVTDILVGLRVGGHLALSLHSSNEPGVVWAWSKRFDNSSLYEHYVQIYCCETSQRKRTLAVGVRTGRGE